MADLRYLPAFADLLRGWQGPAQFRQHNDWFDGVVIRPTAGCVAVPGVGTRVDGYDPEHNIRLDTHRPEVIALLARWLAEGERCPTCWPYTHSDQCSACNGTGYLRRPTPAHPLLPTWLGGQLSTEVAGEALALSALRVRAGLGVVRGLLGTWGDRFRTGDDDTGGLVQVGCDARGWVIQRISDRFTFAFGFETGPEGMACADRAALTAGFALTNPDGSIEWPPLPEVRRG